MVVIAIWGAVAIGACLLSGLIAVAKKRDFSVWMAWTFLLPPLLLVLLLLPRNAGPAPRRPTLDEQDRAEAS